MKPLIAPRPLGIIAMVLGAGLYLAHLATLPKRQNTQCQTNLKQLGLAMFQYTRDYDEMYPLTPNWKEELRPYLRWIHVPNDSYMFACPTTEHDYALNAQFGGFAVAKFDRPESMALFYEPSHPVNADEGDAWATKGVHWEGSNVCFNDGHVKWMTSKPFFGAPEPTPIPKTTATQKPPIAPKKTPPSTR